MNMHVDPHAAHATYAPSSAHRWTVCTASAEAISRLPEQEEGEAAAKGTAAHEELERVLGGGAPNADHESAYGIALAAAFIQKLQPGKTWVEQRVHLTDQIWGRLDFGHWHEESATVTILDLKDGFVDVSPVENDQERIYAKALIRMFDLPAKHVRYVICQPNSIVPGPRLKQWLESADDLHSWSEKVVTIPTAPKQFVAGEQCKYCPLFGRCPASQDVLLRLNAMLASPPDAISSDQVALFTALKKPIDDWFKSLDKVATKRALAGDVAPGMKLVTSVKHRDWLHDDWAREFVVNKFGVKALNPPTPAQVEKLGATKEELEGLVHVPDGGPALAFESDRRKPWVPRDSATMFAGIPGLLSDAGAAVVATDMITGRK